MTSPLRPTGRGRLAVLLTTAGCFAATVLGDVGYTRSAAHQTGHDPDHGLQQLDLLYLDQPAPDAGRLGLPAGRAALVVFCDGCPAPQVDGAQVVVSPDAALADSYALGPQPGGPRVGYALVDATGRLRYRTYDPSPAAHAPEIQRLVDGLGG